MICAEVSLYPLKTNQASEIINESLTTLDRQNVDYKVGSISTHIHGNAEQVWASLRQLFDKAQAASEVSMVVTITNAADDEIQGRHRVQGRPVRSRQIVDL
ncbi:MAG: hypothetical protein HPY81_08125 [Firmicutes bacterium]|nr:hypothetical protein [Bacillota bacterium]